MEHSVPVGRGRSHCAAVHCLRRIYQEEGGPLPQCLPCHLLSVEGDQNARSPLALVAAKPPAYYGAENRGAERIRMVTHHGRGWLRIDTISRLEYTRAHVLRRVRD
jgi:hypothetical protein